MANSTHDENGVKHPPITLLIQYDAASGQFGMQGTPPNQITALGMLDLAAHMVRSGQFQPAAARSAIVKPPPGLTVPRNAQ